MLSMKEKLAYIEKVMRSCRTNLQADVTREWGLRIAITEMDAIRVDNMYNGWLQYIRKLRDVQCENENFRIRDS